MAKKVRDPSKSPEHRREAARAALEAKVLLLEEWKQNGLPYQATYPKNLTALRKWTGPHGNLATWKDPMIGRETGKYPDLAIRFREAVQSLENRGSERDAELREAEAKRDRHAAESQALRLQNAVLVARVDALEREKVLWDALASARAASKP